MPHSLIWYTTKKKFCQVYSPVAMKMNETTWIPSQPQSANEILQEYIQRFTDLVIYAAGTDPTAILASNHCLIYNKKKTKKDISGGKQCRIMSMK